MAAGAYTFYNKAHQYLQDGTVDLDSDTVKAYLFKGTSNAATSTLTALSEITNSCAGGYEGPQALASRSFTALNGSATYKFSCVAFSFSANAADITSIQYLVIAESAGACICWCQLSSAAFPLTDGNKLTINTPTNGIYVTY